MDSILVGDSLGMVMQGHANALSVTLGEADLPHQMRGPRREAVFARGRSAVHDLSAIADASSRARPAGW